MPNLLSRSAAALAAMLIVATSWAAVLTTPAAPAFASAALPLLA